VAPTTSTTQAPLNLSISFALAPGTVDVGGRPDLVWNITADRFVRVAINGPNGFYAETLSGQAPACPSGCTPADNGATYSLTVYDGDRLVGQRSILLTVR
jgi:hypothetical protein